MIKIAIYLTIFFNKPYPKIDTLSNKKLLIFRLNVVVKL